MKKINYSYLDLDLGDFAKCHLNPIKGNFYLILNLLNFDSSSSFDENQIDINYNRTQEQFYIYENVLNKVIISKRFTHPEAKDLSVLYKSNYIEFDEEGNIISVYPKHALVGYKVIFGEYGFDHDIYNNKMTYVKENNLITSATLTYNDKELYKFIYTYSDSQNLTKISYHDEMKVKHDINIEYDLDGRITTLSKHEYKYIFTYDTDGRLSSLSSFINDNLVDKSTLEYSNDCLKITNKDGEISYKYFENNRCIGSIDYDGSTTFNVYKQYQDDYYVASSIQSPISTSSRLSNSDFSDQLKNWGFSGSFSVGSDDTVPIVHGNKYNVLTLKNGNAEQAIDEPIYQRTGYSLSFIYKGTGKVKLLFDLEEISEFICNKSSYCIGAIYGYSENYASRVKVVIKGEDLKITALNLRQTEAYSETEYIDSRTILTKSGNQTQKTYYDDELEPIKGVGTNLGGYKNSYNKDRVFYQNSDTFTEDIVYNGRGLIKSDTKKYYKDDFVDDESESVTTEYFYDDYHNKPIGIKEDNYLSSKEYAKYEYDDYGREVKESLYHSNGDYYVTQVAYKNNPLSVEKTFPEQNKNTSTYNEEEGNGFLQVKEVKENSRNPYCYTYNSANEIESISFNDSKVCEYKYNGLNLLSELFDYQNGYAYRYDYDIDKRVTNIYYRPISSDIFLIKQSFTYDDRRLSREYGDKNRSYKEWLDDDLDLRKLTILDNKTQSFLLSYQKNGDNVSRIALTDTSNFMSKGPSVIDVSYEDQSYYNSSSLINLLEGNLLRPTTYTLLPVYYADESKKDLDLSFVSNSRKYVRESHVEGTYSSTKKDGPLRIILDKSSKLALRDNLAIYNSFTVGLIFKLKKDMKETRLFYAYSANVSYELKYKNDYIYLRAGYGFQVVNLNLKINNGLDRFIFVSFSINNDGDKKIRLFVDGEYKETDSGPHEIPEMGNSSYGGTEEVELCGLFYDMEVAEDELSMNETYRLFNDYLLKSYSMSRSYYAPITTEVLLEGRFENCDVYPLHHDFLSTLGKMTPVKIENVYSNSSPYEGNQLFRYNGDVGRYMLFLNGNKVVYNLQNLKEGSIVACYYLLSGKSNRTLLSLVSGNESIALSVPNDEDRKLHLRKGSQLINTGLVLKSAYYPISLTYKKKSDTVYTISVLIFYGLYGGTEEFTTDITLNSAVTGLKFCLGCDMNSKDSYLSGFMEHLIISKKSLHSIIKDNPSKREDYMPLSKQIHTSSDGLLRQEGFTYGATNIMNSWYYYEDYKPFLPQVKKVQYGIYKNSISFYLEYSYADRNTIDENNLTLVKIDGCKEVKNKYKYDKNNRLTKAEIYIDSKSKIYEYSYTNEGNIKFVSPEKTTTEYDSYNRLKKIGSQSITYDDRLVDGKNVIGIHPTDDGIRQYEWSENLLTGIKKYGSYIQRNTYDTQGLRIQKIVGEETHDYLYSNNRLIQEDIYEKNIRKQIIYDNMGRPYILRYKTKEKEHIFYYITDVEGKIIFLYDDEFNNKIQYIYDPYGNIIEILCSENFKTNFPDIDIQTLSPILYKSYIYDPETNLYYCISRFYNPKWCRWLSGDSLEYLDPEKTHGLNIYAYCENDPINKADPNGNFSFLLCFIFGAIFGGIGAGYNSYRQGNTGKTLIIDIIFGAFLGGINGVSFYLGGLFAADKIALDTFMFGFKLTTVSSFGLGILGSGAHDLSNGEMIDWNRALFSGFSNLKKNLSMFFAGIISFGSGLWRSLDKGYFFLFTAFTGKLLKNYVLGAIFGLASWAFHYGIEFILRFIIKYILGHDWTQSIEGNN